MPDPVTGAIGGSAVLGFIGSQKGASAQKSAANTQAAAQQYATDQQLAFAREARELNVPLYENALAQSRSDLIGNTHQANLALQGARDTATAQAYNAEGITGQQAYDAEGRAINQFNEADGRAVGLYNPYAQEGQAALARIQSGDYREDPGYRFRLQEGLDAVEASAAARGGLFSGATGQALQTRGQNEASQEYQNVFARNFGLAEMGMQANSALTNSAFQRAGAISNATQNRAGMVSDAANNRAGMVSNAAGNFANAFGGNMTNLGSNLANASFGVADGIAGQNSNFSTNAGNAMSQYATGIGAAAANRGDATAAGYAGMTNAIGGGVSNYLSYDAFRNMRSPGSTGQGYLQSDAFRRDLVSGF